MIRTNIIPELEEDTDRPISTIHIRHQQRNGKKCITLIEGLATDLDLKKIVRAMKKTFQTSGAIIDTEDHGKVIQLSGDQRKTVQNFLVKYKVWESPDPPIKIHGF